MYITRIFLCNQMYFFFYSFAVTRPGLSHSIGELCFGEIIRLKMMKSDLN